MLQLGTLIVELLLLDHQLLALLLLKARILTQIAHAAHHLIERLGREEKHQSILKSILRRHQAQGIGIVVTTAVEFGLQGYELLFDALDFTVGSPYVGIEAGDKLLLLLDLCSQSGQCLQLTIDSLLSRREQLLRFADCLFQLATLGLHLLHLRVGLSVGGSDEA